MRKIIFLDFDGVLNTEHYQGLLQYQGKSWQDEYGAFFDPNAVKQLKRIIDATGADIVVESSWKYLGLDAMKELWKVRSLPGRVIDITPSSVSDEYLSNVDLDNLDASMLHCKGLEISSWLSEKGQSNTRYVIIDDEYVEEHDDGTIEYLERLENKILTDIYGVYEDDEIEELSDIVAKNPADKFIVYSKEPLLMPF